MSSEKERKVDHLKLRGEKGTEKKAILKKRL